MASGYEFPPTATFAIDVWHKFLSLVDLDTVQPYIARLEGEAVATSLLLLGAGVAGIYSVATIPTARRKGIGAWVTLHPLLEARAMGLKAGVLEASEMGEGVYRALGFEKYCHIRSYRIQA
jgi:GNAT superfamily N-acetyltransferase